MAQKLIAIEKLGELGFRDQVAVRQSCQRDQGVWCAEPAILTAVCELKCLGDEFDLTNAATSKLHVYSGLALLLLVDKLLRTANTLERAFNGYVPGKNSGLDSFKEGLVHIRLAGACPRADQDLALPVASFPE